MSMGMYAPWPWLTLSMHVFMCEPRKAGVLCPLSTFKFNVSLFHLCELLFSSSPVTVRSCLGWSLQTLIYKCFCRYPGLDFFLQMLIWLTVWHQASLSDVNWSHLTNLNLFEFNFIPFTTTANPETQHAIAALLPYIMSASQSSL